jgi:hypothetical protein
METQPVRKHVIAYLDIVGYEAGVGVGIETADHSVEQHEAVTASSVHYLLAVLIQSNKTLLVRAPVFAWLCYYNTRPVGEVVARAARRALVGNSWTWTLSELEVGEE